MRRKLVIPIFLIAVIAGVLSGKTFAYDGDVDYMAPYLTVDPETGKLVTVDPRQGTVTEHPASAPEATTTPEQTTKPDSEGDTSYYNLQVIAAMSGLIIIMIGTVIFFRKAK